MREPSAATLPVPPWMAAHGEIRVRVFVDMNDTSYEARCQRHYTSSGLVFGSSEEAWRWRCPDCLREASDHERATRDD